MIKTKNLFHLLQSRALFDVSRLHTTQTGKSTLLTLTTQTGLWKGRLQLLSIEEHGMAQGLCHHM
jgi:hypothetical protein